VPGDWATVSVGGSSAGYFLRIRNTATATTGGTLGPITSTNFTVASTAIDDAVRPVTSGIGYMQGSRDNVETFVWVHTPTKHGILCFGRKVVGYSWYGPYPMYSAPYAGGAATTLCADYISPTGGNGYHSSQDDACLYLFDPAQLFEVAANTRYGNANGNGVLQGINADDTVNWHTLWPNIPSTIADQAWICAKQGNSATWDEDAQQLIWVHPYSWNAAAVPTVQVFSVS
jgi:hypothetical protein